VKKQSHASRRLFKFCAPAALLSFVLFPVTAQNEPVFVDFTVQHNGEKISPPDHVTLTVGDHSLDVPVRDGKFELPEKALGIKSDSLISFRTVIGTDEIKLELMRGKFNDRWTLILEDHKFEAEYQSLLKRKKAISACVVVFSPKPRPEDTRPVIRDSTFYLGWQCRTPLKK
jgi:hypothetical protein